jgi:type IV pilus assembly protein PilQ
MIPLIAALWLAATGSGAEVKHLSVVPASNRTEVVIRVEGDVRVTHSFLREGNRLVLDLKGAQQQLRLDFPVNRGGVVGIRLAQFQPEIARVVISLAQPLAYDVKTEGGVVRVSFPNPTSAFEEWSMGLGKEKAPQAPARVEAPARTEAPPAAEAKKATTLTPAAAAVQREASITVQFVDQPINDVLAVFAEHAKKSIVAAPDVATRVINADIKDQPWDLSLQAILTAYGLIMREEESGILVVESVETVAARDRLEPVQTRQYNIEYVSADSLLMTVRSLLTPTGKVEVNPAANSLLVTDTRSTIERITPIIKQLDVKLPQVSISAKIVFIDRTALQELGFVYDLKDSRGNQLNTVVPGFIDQNNNGIFEPDEQTDNNVVLLGGNSIAALANANFRVAKPALQLLGSLVLGRHSLITFVDALQSVSVSDVQAAPVVRTMANREARIQVGERTPIRTIDVGAQGQGSGGVARATVRTENTGIILRVTPMITGNQILLDIHAERSNIGLAPSDLGATFNTQEADTQVLVEDGETAVIGGLTLIEKLKVRAGIPFLMDLPVLGALFRQQSERENKRDLLIMVTPHIIRDGAQ